MNSDELRKASALELQSQLYGWLGDRTAAPRGGEWEHGPLQQLVRDLLVLPGLAALRAKADAVDRVEAALSFTPGHVSATRLRQYIRAALDGKDVAHEQDRT